MRSVCALLALVLGIVTPAILVAQSAILRHTGGGTALHRAIVVDDLDGDGHPDLLRASPTVKGASKGWVRLLSGRDMRLIFEFQGDGRSVTEFMGLALDTMKDLDQDGVPEIVIGVPGGGVSGAGEV